MITFTEVTFDEPFKIVDRNTNGETFAVTIKEAYQYVRFFAGILGHSVSLFERNCNGEYQLRAQWNLEGALR